MNNQDRAKEVVKATRKNEKDAVTLMHLLEGKVNRKEADHVINRMIVRTETIWQWLRTMGRMVDGKESNEESS